MNQAGQAFDCRFLIALRAGEFGLIAGLFFKDRRDKGRDGFDLMAVRPRQQLSDILLDACRLTLCCHHTNRVSQVVNLCRHARLQKLSRHQVVDASQEAQKALGGRVPRNTLSNALRHRDLDQMIEAWMMILQRYSPYIEKMGRKYARIAAVDASLIKLSLAAFSWATYREKTGAAKITCVLNWVQGVPEQFVFTASGKIHDMKATASLKWSAGWTYLFDRGYFSFDLLTTLLNVGAHFVIRLKRGVEYRNIRSNPIPNVKLPAGVRAIKLDQTVGLSGWASDVILRLVVYQLTDGKIIRVLTSRHDLSALSITMLYKEK